MCSGGLGVHLTSLRRIICNRYDFNHRFPATFVHGSISSLLGSCGNCWHRLTLVLRSDFSITFLSAMPESLLQHLRSTLRDLERYQRENPTFPRLDDVKRCLQEAVATLELKLGKKGKSSN